MLCTYCPFKSSVSGAPMLGKGDVHVSEISLQPCESTHGSWISGTGLNQWAKYMEFVFNKRFDLFCFKTSTCNNLWRSSRGTNLVLD